MKISVFAKQKTGWHYDQLKLAADKFGCEIEKVNITNLNDYKEFSKSLGDVVIWRSADIDIKVGRTAFIGMLKNKYVINQTLSKFPYIAYKLFQQKYIENFTVLNGIQTYNFKNKKELFEAVDSGLLKYPFIQKPNLGSKGNGVSLIKSKEELENQEIVVREYIYQNFIKNTGDFRVFVLGGKVLGVMKRVAAEGNFLNNVSQGGSATLITDPEIISKVSRIALPVASLFSLSMCGVDVIFDEEEQVYRFMEVNTAPQWKGLQTVVPFNIGEEIVKHCILLAKRKDSLTFDLIKESYDENFNFLPDKKFHYASRMFLWNRDEKYKNWLDNLKQDYCGNTLEETEQIIKEISEREYDFDEAKTLSKKLRTEFNKKYPDIYRYNRYLFMTLFCDQIWNYDIRPVIAKYISDSELEEMKNNLIQDRKAISILSTHAINFFYLLQNYWKDERNFIDPKLFLDIALNDYGNEVSENKLRFQIYLLTHCIIGESKFYARKISNNLEVYQEMMKFLENQVFANYFAVSLDNKFEFLVCAKMCGYKSFLENMIKEEAKRSYSDIGNFLIDKLTDKSDQKLQNQMAMSEHRNVLFLMANSEPNF